MARRFKTVGECFGSKAGVHTIGPDASVLDALELLAKENIGALVVVNGGRIVGILSERDIVRKGERQGRTARETRVRDLMTEGVRYVTPGHTLAECMLVMHQHRLRHLPVLEGERIAGLLSSRDILAQMVEEDERTIRDLERDRMLIINPSAGNY